MLRGAQRSVISLFALVLVMLIPNIANAQDFAGSWAMRADGTIIWRFDITQNTGEWTGGWTRPAHFETDGFAFENVQGPARTFPVIEARQDGDALILTFEGEQGSQDTTSFRFRETGEGRLLAEFTEAPLPPFVLEPMTEPVTPGPWTAGKKYQRTIWYPTNAEMTAIFEADQKARRGDAPINWANVSEQDAQRRERTQQLLDAGALQSGDDFYHAAFVFQHGSEPDHFLKAHVLAMIATARGKPGAIRISAATLDRYLQAIGQKQVFGTQYSTRPGEETTQEPYDRELLSDAIREAASVPSQSAQESRRKEVSRQGG